MVPLVVSVALALLPSIDGAISRSPCCFVGMRWTVAVLRRATRRHNVLAFCKVRVDHSTTVLYCTSYAKREIANSA